MGYGDGKDRHEQRAAIHGPGWLPLPWVRQGRDRAREVEYLLSIHYFATIYVATTSTAPASATFHHRYHRSQVARVGGRPPTSPR
eukprot:COSAG02_NODE_954_length_15689_cov_14.145927_1_plen_85_part_00